MEGDHEPWVQSSSIDKTKRKDSYQPTNRFDLCLLDRFEIAF